MRFLLIISVTLFASSSFGFEYHCRPMPAREAAVKKIKEAKLTADAIVTLTQWTYYRRQSEVDAWEEYFQSADTGADKKLFYRSAKEFAESRIRMNKENVGSITYIQGKIEAYLEKYESGYLGPIYCPSRPKVEPTANEVTLKHSRSTNDPF